MQLPITIQILVQNNEDTVEQTFDSILPLNPQDIIVIDLGSYDKTISICNRYTTKIIKGNKNNRSEIRNNLTLKSQTDWQMYIEPYEVILAGHEDVRDLTHMCYHCNILQGDIVTKEIRIWNKNSRKLFVNPIFEKIADENSKYLDVMFYKIKENDNFENEIKKWKSDNSLAIEPYYYQALASLSNKEYKEFKLMAEHYLFKSPVGIAATMIRYYLAIVEFYVNNNPNKAIQNIILCLKENLLMAEFWCLLGDIYLQNKEFKNAVAFYENAKWLGSHRLKEDKWPMHLPNYEVYPDEMIGKCKSLLFGSDFV